MANHIDYVSFNQQRPPTTKPVNNTPSAGCQNGPVQSAVHVTPAPATKLPDLVGPPLGLARARSNGFGPGLPGRMMPHRGGLVAGDRAGTILLTRTGRDHAEMAALHGLLR